MKKPVFLPQIANSVAVAFKEHNLEERNQYAKDKGDFFDDLVERSIGKLSELQQEVAKERRKLVAKDGVTGAFAADMGSEYDMLKELRVMLDKAEVKRIEIGKIIEGLERRAKGAGGLEGEIARLESKKRELLLTYKEKHPEVRTLTKVIEQKRRELEERKDRPGRHQPGNTSQ